MMFFMYSVLAISSVSLAVRLAIKKPPVASNEATKKVQNYLKETHHWADEYQNAQRSYQRLHAEFIQKSMDFERLTPAQQQAHRTALNELKTHLEQRKIRMQQAQARYKELVY
ncbi:hypothetical protein [Vibrio rarus]|uniref:hypothetical protein n=1 Tax=Vibrio rarus TaxID=413403 RepID=UPI0021C456FF|nr:hypothetical protein [Vibrio rarus]